MSFKLWLENENELIIPPGTTLFHGSLEPFKEKQLKIGGYDKILWLAETPAIAQAYIPRAGSHTVISPGDLAKPLYNAYPSKKNYDDSLRKLQRDLGIIYDYTKVEWQPNGRAQSWPLPKKKDGSSWDHIIEPEEVAELLEKAGFVPLNPNSAPRWRQYEFLMHGMKDYFPPGETATGRLFIVTVKHPLKIFDMTFSGEVEGDLMNPQYHKIGTFRKLEEKNFDGVKIADFAQIHNWGNTGHDSIGIFANSINKLSWKTISAKHVDWEHARKNKGMTPEYLKHIHK